MKDLLQRLGSKHNLAWMPPISEEDMDAFEGEAGFRLAPELRQLYGMCGGLAENEWESYIVPFEQACTYALDIRAAGFPEIWHYFPVADFNESNPLCICCGDMMNGYVVHVYHDDVAYVKYRSLEAMFTDFLDDSPVNWSERTSFVGDLTNAALRTPHDIEMAHKLIHRAQSLTDNENSGQADAFRFGFEMLSENEIGEIAAHLENNLARNHALKRLIKIATPTAHEVVNTFHASANEFLNQCIWILQQAGIAGFELLEDRHALRLIVEGRDISIHLIDFYPERHRPDFDLYFVAQIEDSLDRLRFTVQCLTYLRQAQIVKLRENSYGYSIRLDLSGAWVNTQPFYAERHRPDFEAYFLDHVRQLLEGKKRV